MDNIKHLTFLKAPYSLLLKTALKTTLLFFCFHLFPLCANTVAHNNSTAYDDSHIQQNTIQYQDVNLYYRFSGKSLNNDKYHDSDKKNLGVIFIHGTPGSSGAFSYYLHNKLLQQHFFMVAMDRPGWGNSQRNKDIQIGDFNYQAGAAIKIMEQYPEKKWIVVGHSLGASIVPNIALLKPRLITSLILLSGSLSPQLGKPRWYNKISNNKLLYWLLPHSLAHSNREIIALHQQLLIMNEAIQSKKLPISLNIIQGMNDKLVSPKNSLYAKINWANHFEKIQIIQLENQGHFVPWEQKKLIINTLLDIAKTRE